jgi:hypothetical protein
VSGSPLLLLDSGVLIWEGGGREPPLELRLLLESDLGRPLRRTRPPGDGTEFFSLALPSSPAFGSDVPLRGWRASEAASADSSAAMLSED